jgi:phospholipase C
MTRNLCVVVYALLTIGLCSRGSYAAQSSPSGLAKVNHVIIAMQENHSFDNYFGVLALAQNSPYHSPAKGNSCAKDPNPTTCVEGLSCVAHSDGTYTCSNSNLDTSGANVPAFHTNDYCPAPDSIMGGRAATKRATSRRPTACSSLVPTTGSCASMI